MGSMMALLLFSVGALTPLRAGEAGAESDAVLFEQAASTDAAVRQRALKVLSKEYRKRWLGQEALPVLARGLSAADPLSRVSAAETLGGIASLVYIATRSAEGTAYGRKVDADFSALPGLEEGLRKALSDASPDVRRYAAVALGFAYPPSPGIEEALVKRWKKERVPLVRRGILIALGKARYSSPRVLSLLEKALKDPDPRIRRRADEALRLIKEKPGG